MDKRLEEYRRQKQREEFFAKAKNQFAELQNILHNGIRLRRVNQNNSNLDESNEPLLQISSAPEHPKLSDSEEDIEHRVPSDTEIDNINCCTGRVILKYLFYFIIWSTVYYIFILWGFGSVYFIITALIAMYFNTGTRRKEKGEKSAYSVFNKNCESIHGTVKAEDLEKQMIYGRLF